MTRLIRWKDGLWALLVLLAASVMACGLADSFTFLVRPPTYFEGHRLVLLGAPAFAASSVWAALKGRSLRAVIATALPAVVVGGRSNCPTACFRMLPGWCLSRSRWRRCCWRYRLRRT
ncbi:hypothetical protein ARTHRO9AX_220154 [Arthrobacter sp. 9AX]|nr:hypothetical protein ARTHRO9AX_220154 [Arthrobacter sp. 9AX]